MHTARILTPLGGGVRRCPPVQHISSRARETERCVGQQRDPAVPTEGCRQDERSAARRPGKPPYVALTLRSFRSYAVTGRMPIRSAITFWREPGPARDRCTLRAVFAWAGLRRRVTCLCRWSMRRARECQKNGANGQSNRSLCHWCFLLRSGVGRRVEQRNGRFYKEPQSVYKKIPLPTLYTGNMVTYIRSVNVSFRSASRCGQGHHAQARFPIRAVFPGLRVLSMCEMSAGWCGYKSCVFSGLG
jgi:hypothetical protein